LFETSSVRRTRPTPHLFPDSFAFIRLPVTVRDRHGDCGPDEVSQVPMRCLCMRWGLRPRRSVSPSRSGTAPLAFSSVNGLGLHDIVLFTAQSPTPRNRRVRFAAVVAYRPATLTAERPLRLTRTGLPPAATRQLPGALTVHTQFGARRTCRHRGCGGRGESASG
jgi:hypothetical protein